MTLLSNLEKRIQKNPKSLLFAHIADIYLKEGRTDEAIALCEQGIKYHPSYTTGHYILAKAYLSQGDQDKAETEFKMVLSHDRGFLTAHKYLGDIMARSGWENKAAIHYRDLLRIDPLDQEARAMLKSFSIEEPFQETGFHETVPSRSEEELRLEEKTTGIRKKDWEEEFDELFKSDTDNSRDESTGGPEAEAAAPLFDAGEAREPSLPSATEDDSEEFIDLSAFDDTSFINEAEQKPDAVTDGSVPDSGDGPAAAGEESEQPSPETSDSLLLDVSLNDLDAIAPADHPIAEVRESETAPPPKPGIPAGEFDDLDLSAFEKIDEMFSREIIEPADGEPFPETGTSLFETETVTAADAAEAPGLDANESPAQEDAEHPESDRLAEEGSVPADGILTDPGTDSGITGVSAEPASGDGAEKHEPEGLILDIPEPGAEFAEKDQSEKTAAETGDESAVEFTFGEFEENDPEPAPGTHIAPPWTPEPEPKADAEPVPAPLPEPEQDISEDGKHGEKEAAETAPKIVSPTLGEIYAAQGQYAKAQKVFEQLSDLHPDNEQYKQKIEEMRKKARENS